MRAKYFGAVAAAFIATTAIAQDQPNYALRLADNGSTVDVHLCLAQAHPDVAFAADSNDAMKYIADIRRDSNAPLTKTDEGWSAHDWHAKECLLYTVQLDAISAAHDQDIGWRMGDDRVAAPQLLLLRPDTQNGAAQASVSLPDGWSFSAPWNRTNQNRKSIQFSIPDTPTTWSANVAFGHFTEEDMPLPGGDLRVSILHGADDAQRAKLHAWLSRVTRAILSAYGRLPLPDVQVLVFPLSSHRGRAVIFGQSIRGEGNALELLVDASRPESEFDSDWIAVHELSHLMHPYLGDRGSWLAEGLATYYQNVLRARAGLLTPAQAWDRLREGFSDQAASYSETLEQSAGDMHHTHDFRRVYWSGAAFWLTVDRDLRQSSDGKLTLDLALSRFHDCCLPSHHGWKPEDFVAKLDSLLGVHAISTRYHEFAAMRTFPDWKKVYKELGIRDSGEHLQLDPASPNAALRDAIMAPRETTN